MFFRQAQRQFAEELRRQNLIQRKGCFCGLLVKEVYAKKFVQGLKIMEVRSRSFKFLAGQDRILLVSTSSKKARQILAILEYEFTVTLTDDTFSRYFPCHRVTEEEFQEYKSSVRSSTFFGMQFKLAHAFPEPPIWNGKSGEVWVYVDPVSVTIQTEQRSLRGSGSSESCAAVAASSASALKRSLTSTSFGTTCSSQKRQRQRMMDGQAGDFEEQEDEAEGDTEVEEEPESLAKDKDHVVCCLFQDFEWNALVSGHTSSIIRPFAAHEQKLVVLVREQSGHMIVGEVEFASCAQLDCQARRLLKQNWGSVYSNDRLNSIKNNKAAWTWEFCDIVAYDVPFAARFLSIAPRFRNRPFVLTKSQLEESEADAPTGMDFYETGKFLVNQLSMDMKEVLAQRIASLSNGRACIRVGTTCSGTDVCIPALKELVRFLNESQAGCFAKNPHVTFSHHQVPVNTSPVCTHV